MARGVFSTANYLSYGGGIITSTPLTIAARVKPSSTPAANQYIAGLFYTSAGTGIIIDGWAMRIFESGGVVDAVVGNGVGTNIASSASGVNAGAWNHIAAKFVSATSRYAYLNGVAGTQGTNNNTPSTAPDKTAIGVSIRENNTTGQPSTICHIAEVGFWNTDLTDAEIAMLALGVCPLFVRPQNLVAYYPLIRGDGSGDEPNPKNAAYKMVEQGTISVQPHPPVFMPSPRPVLTFAAGGTANNQSASGGTTPSGAVVRSTAKSPAGELSPAGSVNKSTAKSPSGSVTADGDIGKSAGKPLSGTIAPVGSLAQQVSKSFSGDLPSDGDVEKNISKVLAGSLSSSGALTVIRNFLAELTGTLLSAGDVNKGVSKLQSGTVDGEGDLARTTGKPTVGSISPTGLLTTIKLFVEDMVGSLAPTSEVLKQITKAFSGDIANTGEITKSTAKAFSGDLTSTGVLSSIRAFVRDIGGEATSAGEVSKSSAKSPSGSLSLSGGVAVQSQKSPAGQTQPSGVLSFLTGKGFPGNLSPSGALSTVFIPGGGTIYNQSAAGSAVLSGNLATLFTPGVPAATGANIESWGGAFADDINPRPRRRTTPEPPVDDDEEAMVAILLSRFRK